MRTRIGIAVVALACLTGCSILGSAGMPNESLEQDPHSCEVTSRMGRMIHVSCRDADRFLSWQQAYEADAKNPSILEFGPAFNHIGRQTGYVVMVDRPRETASLPGKR